MKRIAPFALILLAGSFAAPFAASAATFASGRTLVLSEAPLDNAYLWGTDVNVVAPLPADLAAFAGSAVVSAPVSGDANLAGGSVEVRRAIGGDARVAGATVAIDAPIAGDLLATGGTVVASSTARDTRIIGRAVRLTGTGGGAHVYGADVTLSGEITGDVTVVASDRLSILPGTHIAGVLKYDAPAQAEIPADAVIAGGVTYTGSSSFLPTNEEAHRLAVAGLGVFFVVRIIALLVAAGLVAGLFPLLANAVAERALDSSLRRLVLLTLLGFAVVVAAPVLILLLLVSFVGTGVAILLGIFYALLLAFSYLFAGLLAGAALARGISKRRIVSWRDAVLGMLVLALVGAIPVLGGLVALILMLAAAGALISISYRFAFGRAEGAEDDLGIS